MTNYFGDDPLDGPAWACARQLWRDGRLRPDDVDVAQIYDAFTPLDPALARGLRVLRAGRGRPRSPRTAASSCGGRLPVNTSGGGLSEAYVHGFNLITEGGPAAAGHVAEPGRRAPRPASSPRARACPPAPCCCGVAIAVRPSGRRAAAVDRTTSRAVLGGPPAAASCGSRRAGRAGAGASRPGPCARLPVARRPLGGDVRAGAGSGRSWCPTRRCSPPTRRRPRTTWWWSSSRRTRRIRFVGNLVTGSDGGLGDVDPATIEIGAAVEVCFGPELEGIRMPRWTITGSGG